MNPSVKSPKPSVHSLLGHDARQQHKYGALTQQLLILLLVWAWMSVAYLGNRPWSSRGEPREAIVAQSMLASGDYILGKGYGEIVPSKPPLLHWSAIALSMPGGEVTEFTMRVPSALAALCILIVVFFVGQRLFPTVPALLAPLLLATSFEFFRSSIEARVDMVLCAAMFGSLLTMNRFLLCGSLLSGFGSALLVAIAVLAKGPVGVILPVGVLTFFWWFDLKNFQRPFLLAIPAVLGSAIAAIWYWQALEVGGQAFFDRVVYENFLRFLGGQEDQPHDHSAPYLFAMLLIGWLPWVFTPLRRIKLRTEFLSQPVAIARSWWSRVTKWYRELLPNARLLVVWSALVFVFFCIPGSKRGVYLLPIYPALAILLAHAVSTRLVVPLFRILGGILLIAGCLGIALELGLLSSLSLAAKPGVAIEALTAIAASSPTIWLAHIVLVIAGGTLFFRARRIDLLSAALLYAIGLGGIHGGLLPLGARWVSPASFAKHLQTEVSPDTRLLSFDYEFYGLSFYLHRPIFRIEVNPPQVGDVVIFHEKQRAFFDQQLSHYGISKYEFVARSLGPVDAPFKSALVVRIVELMPGGV